MFSRFVTLLAIVALVVAAPQTTPNTPQTGSNAGSNASNSGSASQCAASSQYCCNQGFSVRHLFQPLFPGTTYECICSQDPATLSGNIGGVLNPISGVTVPAGLTCTPIGNLGLGSAGDCSVKPACCTQSTGVSSHHGRLSIRTDRMIPFLFFPPA